MATIGDLVINLRGDIAEFTRNMKKSAASVANVAAEVAKYGAVAAAAAAGGLAMLTKESMKNIDAMAKTADKLGIVVEELAGLRHAAELSGVASNTLDMALQRMTRRVSEAARGTGEAKDALRELGLDAQKLAQMAPDQAFREIAGAMEGVSTQGDKVRLAMRLFDSEGVALVNTLAMGKEGLDASAESARAYGTALSRVSAAKVEAANDAMFETGQVLAGLGNTLAVELSPYIQAIAKQFSETAKETNGFRDEVKTAVDFAVSGLGWIADSVRGLHAVLKALTLGFQALGTGILDIASRVAEGWNRIFELIVRGIGETVRLANNIPGVEIPTDGIDAFAESLRRVAEEQAAIRERMHESVAQTADELHELAMRPMPSEGIKQWAAEVQAEAQKAAEAVAAARQGAAVGGEGTTDPKAAEEAERLRAQLENRLAIVAEYAMVETERERLAYENRQLIVDQALENKLISEQAWQDLSVDLYQRYQDRLTEIETAGLTERQQFQRMTLQQQAQTVFGELSSITQGVAQHNKKLFQLNKVAGIANAIVSAYEGISLTMAKYPYPLNIGMAAAHAAAAFAQVQAIRSASFGGGGAGVAPSNAGAGGGPINPSVPQVQGPVQEQTQPSRIVTINLPNRPMDPVYVRQLLEEMAEQTGDNVRFA